jgi:hypothetical protein
MYAAYHLIALRGLCRGKGEDPEYQLPPRGGTMRWPPSAITAA